MHQPSQLLFLPGASGSTAFWEPLANRISIDVKRLIVGYPGFGQEPVDPAISCFEDLVDRVVRYIDQPTAIIAQSMGGVIAMHATLKRPDLVTHLVLTVTSGGIDMNEFGAADWRADLVAANPHFPDWFVTLKSDLANELRGITQPVLLLWGDADPYSPVAVGRRLSELIPRAQLHIVSGGEHDLANVYAADIADLVNAHLA
ncbi:alpha/beta fold hydrolase [Trinickia acidisoli]|uniref:alpha/beta fold hydrolase n=1 Tax=Trinickia acidisoli TaxID=2767482 RepID=UPI001A8E603A|nr:alpha/beta fold hydrolase [Trinickia acidisoli]